MRKMRELLLVFAALLFALPMFAQRGGHHDAARQMEREHHEHAREYHQEYRGGFDQHYDRHARDYRGPRDHRNYAPNQNWHGRDYVGPEHHFFWGHSRWYGRRYCRGSRFFWGRSWFVVVDPVPDYWGDDDVYVVCGPDGFCYLENIRYAERIQIVVIP